MTHRIPDRDPRWRRVAVVAATILVGSVLPSPTGRHPEFSRVGPDKLLHFVGYAGLAAALADAFATRIDGRRATLLAVGVSAAYGVLTGRLQERVPGRENERADLVAGTLGSVAGGLGWRRLGRASTTG
jgi:VanZ family protein